MKTIKENQNLSCEQKIAILKNAKGGELIPNWSPFCLNCASNTRMLRQSYGFQCKSCRNMIGWDLTRLVESPTNEVERISKKI